MTTAPTFRGQIALAAFALLAAPANAQSFGPSSQVLTIGAAEFRSREPYGGLETLWYDGYLYDFYPADPDFNHWYLAPLALPDGALIEEMCLFAHDSYPADQVAINLSAVKLAPGGEVATSRPVGPYVKSTDDPYYNRTCASLSETVRRKLDVDEDGSLDNAVWYIRAYVPKPNFGSLGLGGVRIRWRRTTSPEPSVPTFGDVPPSHGFYEFIEALATSGITGGCGGGNYCPNSPLTRGQMAVFLAKALGLHWPN